jgi:hypothetical protein
MKNQTPKCDAAIDRLEESTWLDQAAARQAARERWMRLATAKRPNTILLASAESELFAAGGDMTDLMLLRQRAWRILKEATSGKI